MTQSVRGARGRGRVSGSNEQKLWHARRRPRRAQGRAPGASARRRTSRSGPWSSLRQKGRDRCLNVAETGARGGSAHVSRCKQLKSPRAGCRRARAAPPRGAAAGSQRGGVRFSGGRARGGGLTGAGGARKAALSGCGKNIWDICCLMRERLWRPASSPRKRTPFRGWALGRGHRRLATRWGPPRKTRRGHNPRAGLVPGPRPRRCLVGGRGDGDSRLGVEKARSSTLDRRQSRPRSTRHHSGLWPQADGIAVRRQLLAFPCRRVQSNPRT